MSSSSAFKKLSSFSPLFFVNNTPSVSTQPNKKDISSTYFSSTALNRTKVTHLHNSFLILEIVKLIKGKSVAKFKMLIIDMSLDSRSLGGIDSFPFTLCILQLLEFNLSEMREPVSFIYYCTLQKQEQCLRHSKY